MSRVPTKAEMKPYVPEKLTPGQPVPVSRALFKNYAFFEAFREKHGMHLGDAIQGGLVVPTNEPPGAPASGKWQQ